MTLDGSVVLIALGLSLLLIWGINRRKAQPMGFSKLLICWLLLLAVSLGGIMTGASLIKSFSIYFTGTQHTATIVDYRSYDSRDSSGDSTRMYTALISFTYQEKLIEKSVNYSSSSIPVVGRSITVFYDEQLDEITQLGIGITSFLAVGLLFAALLLCPLILCILYACGYPKEKISRITTGLGKLLFRLAWVLFWGMLTYVLYLYFFTHEKDHLPLWAISLVAFFNIVLMVFIFTLFQPDKKK